MDAAELIALLDLQPHPEGGWYRETWRGEPGPDGRASGTAIYFLLARGDRSHWHRVDAAEVWHHYGGAPLELAIADGGDQRVVDLAVPDASRPDARPQALVPPHAWQAARSTGDWTLVGATVTPAFEFEGFELAPPGWVPDGWSVPGW